MNERHLTDFDIARILASDQAVDAAAHAADCARCQEELHLASQTARHFDESLFPRSLPAIEARLDGGRRRLRGWSLGLGGLALAAAAAAFLLFVRPPSPPPAVGYKGQATTQVVGRRGDDLFAVSDGASLRAGDALRFVVEPGAAAYVLVVSVDGRGAVNVYFPFDGSASGRAVAGPLPDSVILDDAPGPERIYVIYSERPVAVAEIGPWLRQVAAGGPEHIRRERVIPAPYSQWSILIEKP